jgi:hypothetical protein
MLALALTACGDDGEPEVEDVQEVLSQACDEAADQFAAAPAPTDEASTIEFLEAAFDPTEALHNATFRNFPDDADDVEAALEALRYQTGQYPAVIGDNDTAESVAWEAQGAIAQIDRLTRRLGVLGCEPDAWRLDDYVAITDRRAPRTDAEFLEGLEQVCMTTDLRVTPTLREQIVLFRNGLFALSPSPAQEDLFVQAVDQTLELRYAIDSQFSAEQQSAVNALRTTLAELGALAC